MREFIEELKYNRNIKDTETIRIDYVIERLEDIRKDLEEHVEFFRYHNKNFNNDQDYHMMMIYDNLNDRGKFR